MPRQNALPIVKILATECVVGFDCVCGNRDIWMDDETSPKTCERCGRTYHVSFTFEVEEKGT